MKIARVDASGQVSRPEELFRSGVLPVVSNFAEFLSEQKNLSISLYLNGERVLHVQGTDEGACKAPGVHCDGGCLQVPEAASAQTPRGRSSPRARIFTCEAGRNVYSRELNLVTVGSLVLIACSSSDLPKRGAVRKSLDRVANIILQLVYGLVDWHYLSETLVHELTFVIGSCHTDAERLVHLSEKLAGKEPAGAEADLREVGANLYSETEMATYELENVLRYLSQAGGAEQDSDRYPGPRQSRLELVDLESEVRDVARRMEYRASLRNIFLDSRELLFRERILIRADRFHLRRAFYNLLSNAIKYSYHGRSLSGVQGAGHFRFVRIFLQDPFGGDPLRVACCFENYGVGVVEGESPLLVVPGYRGILAQGEQRIGSGLGLSETQKILSSYSGKLLIETRKASDDELGPQIFVAKAVLCVARRELI